MINNLHFQNAQQGGRASYQEDELYENPEEKAHTGRGAGGYVEEETYENPDEQPAARGGYVEDDTYENPNEEQASRGGGGGGITAIALYDYQAQADDEISFDPNDIISNIEMVSEPASVLAYKCPLQSTHYMTPSCLGPLRFMSFLLRFCYPSFGLTLVILSSSSCPFCPRPSSQHGLLFRLTKAGGLEKPMDASDSSQLIMLRSANALCHQFIIIMIITTKNVSKTSFLLTSSHIHILITQQKRSKTYSP